MGYDLISFSHTHIRDAPVYASYSSAVTVCNNISPIKDLHCVSVRARLLWKC